MTIKLIDARRGLYRKCKELFGDEKIAEQIYRYLCDGIEECENAERVGKWILHLDDLFPVDSTMECNQCHEHQPCTIDDNYCPNCGARMVSENE